MKSYPFDSRIIGNDENGLPIFDRAVGSDVLASLLGRLYSNGIVRDNDGSLGFFASPGSEELQTQLTPGYIIINGRCGDEDQIRVFEHDPPDVNFDRIDRIVARASLELEDRRIELFLIKGVPSENPVAPAPTKTSSIHELVIADVRIKKNTSIITHADITDRRLDNRVCGISEIPLKVFQSEDLYKQIQSDLESFRSKEQADFSAWFDSVKGTLNEDVAGNLLNLIVGKTSTGSRSVFIPADGWSAESPYRQNIMVDGVTARSSCHVILSYDPIYKEEYEACGVSVIEQHNGYLTFELVALPEASFPVNLLVVNPSSGADEPETSANTALLEATAIQLEASGSEITLSDSADAPLMALTVYGKTTQNGTPEPAAPVELVSVGDGGKFTIESTSADNQVRSAILDVRDALRGLKGTHGANFTDASGAQWVTDELNVNADGTGEIVRRVASNVYDGTENWSKLGSNDVGNVFSCTPKIPLANISSPRLASHFVQSDNSSAYSPQGTTSGFMRFAGSETNMLFFIRKDLVASVDEWKSFLAAQYAAGTPVVDVYGCAQETQILTAEEVRSFLLMRTHKPNTTITNTDGAYMVIRYVADTKTYIDNKFAELSTAMIGG